MGSLATRRSPSTARRSFLALPGSATDGRWAGLGAVLDHIDVRRPEPLRAGGNTYLDRNAATGAVLGLQRQDHVDLVQLTSVGGCGRMDAVANVLLTDLAVDVVPMLEEPFFISPWHPAPLQLALGCVDAGNDAVTEGGLDPPLVTTFLPEADQRTP